MLFPSEFSGLSRLIVTPLLLCFSSLIFAQETQSSEIIDADSVIEDAVVEDTVNNSVDIDELTSFIDGYVERMISDFDPPGMTVSVVIGDQTLTKGYGIADMESGTKNDENTLFRIGSISKLFVWLSAHMLADEGKLDLDADINSYLDGFNTHGDIEGPITMRHLMSHRAGFDDNIRDFVDPERDITLEEAVKRTSLLRVAKAGERTSYSNSGTYIAAHIVERISGQTFYDFVEERILKPVGLDSVTLRDPQTGKNDPALDERMAKAHLMEDGIAIKADYMSVRPQEPAGAVAMDAKNAAIFMRMLLNKTQYEGGRLLSEEAWDRITKPAFEDAVGGDDMGWGFMLNDVDGMATVGHGGATRFLSWMFVIPELDMGVFISSNLRSGNSRAELLAWSIVRRVVGTDSMANFMLMEGDVEAAKAIAGNYLNNRRPQDRGINFVGMGNDIKIRATEDGFVLFPGATPTRYAPLGNDIWVNKAGGRIRVAKDDSGNVLRLHLGFGSTTIERIGFIDSKNAVLVGFGGALFFSIMALLGMYYRHGRSLYVNDAGRKLGWVNIFSVVFWFALFGSFAAVMSFMASFDVAEVDNELFPPVSVDILFIAIIVVCIQTLVHLLSIPSVWKSSGWTMLRKINFTLYGLFALFAVYMMYHWKLIGGSIYGM